MDRYRRIPRDSKCTFSSSRYGLRPSLPVPMVILELFTYPPGSGHPSSS